MNYVSAVFFVFTSHANKSWNARMLDGKLLLTFNFRSCPVARQATKGLRAQKFPPEHCIFGDEDLDVKVGCTNFFSVYLLFIGSCKWQPCSLQGRWTR